jgi:DNA-binding transcriptional LysR family regulator
MLRTLASDFWNSSRSNTWLETMMRYELTDLRLFLAVAEAGSLSTGALNFHLSAPSASYRLKNLEQAVGAALFVRGPKGMALTRAGEALLGHVRNVLSAIQFMHGDLARFANGVKGQIRVVANSSCLARLTEPLTRFLVAHPNIDVELEERLSADIVQAVADRVADIGLLAGEVDIQQLEAIPYAQDELIFVTAMEHPLGALREISFLETLEAEFVGLGRKSSNFIFLSQIAGKLGRRLNVRVNVQSFPIVLQLVEENVGVSIVPRSIAVPALMAGRIVGVPLAEPWALRNQRVVAVSFKGLPPFVQEFVECISHEQVTPEASSESATGRLT